MDGGDEAAGAVEAALAAERVVPDDRGAVCVAMGVTLLSVPGTAAACCDTTWQSELQYHSPDRLQALQFGLSWVILGDCDEGLVVEGTILLTAAVLEEGTCCSPLSEGAIDPFPLELPGAPAAVSREANPVDGDDAAREVEEALMSAPLTRSCRYSSRHASRSANPMVFSRERHPFGA
eukprot:6194668-Pleurochrysis_carterae.AAC.3